MYKDLADATEQLKEKGFDHTFELDDVAVTCKELDKHFKPGDLKIVESYTHDEGTDPGSEATIYAIESASGVKGILIISYGMYSDPSKAKLIDKLLKSEEPRDQD